MPRHVHISLMLCMHIDSRYNYRNDQGLVCGGDVGHLLIPGGQSLVC